MQKPLASDFELVQKEDINKELYLLAGNVGYIAEGIQNDLDWQNMNPPDIDLNKQEDRIRKAFLDKAE